MIQLQRYDMALKEITVLLTQYPDNPELHFLMGECHQGKQNISEAKKSFEKAISIEPEHVRALNSLGGVFLKQNNSNRAKMYFETALAIAPYEVAIYGNLARVYLNTRDYKKAIDYAEEGLSLYPQDEYCLNTLFWAYSFQGNHGRATGILEENLRNNPENIETLTNLGNEFYRKDDYAQSEQVFSSLLLLNANNKTSIQGFKRASTANNWLTKIMTNRRIARDAQKWIILSVLLVVLLRRIPGFPVKIYWLLIPFLAQVFALFPLALAIGKLLAYQRQKRLRAQFTFQEIANALVAVSLFAGFLFTITLTGIDLATKETFPVELFLVSFYLALFQVVFSIHMDWFAESLLLRRVFLAVAVGFAVVSLLWIDQWWLLLSCSILILMLDVAYYKGWIFRKSG